MSDRPSDPEALERYIERNVQELARAVDEVVDRVSPKNAARRGAVRLKEEAGQVAKVVGAMLGPPAAAGGGDDASTGRSEGGIDKRVVLAVGAAVTVTALVLWGRR